MILSFFFALILSSATFARPLENGQNDSRGPDYIWNCFYTIDMKDYGYVSNFLCPAQGGSFGVYLNTSCHVQQTQDVPISRCCYTKNLLKFGNLNDNLRNATYMYYFQNLADPACPYMSVPPCIRINANSNWPYSYGGGPCCEAKKNTSAYEYDLYCSSKNWSTEVTTRTSWPLYYD
jgi:hypothetical protein